MTLKSDDVIGRAKMYEAIVNGEEYDEFHLPEAFNVMKKEFQSLGLDIELDIDEEVVAEEANTELSTFETEEAVNLSNFSLEEFDSEQFMEIDENYYGED